MSKKAALIWAGIVAAALVLVGIAFMWDAKKVETTEVSEARFSELVQRARGVNADVFDTAKAICVGLNMSGKDSLDNQKAALMGTDFTWEEMNEYFSYPINTYCPEYAK